MRQLYSHHSTSAKWAKLSSKQVAGSSQIRGCGIKSDQRDEGSSWMMTDPSQGRGRNVSGGRWRLGPGLIPMLAMPSADWACHLLSPWLLVSFLAPVWLLTFDLTSQLDTKVISFLWGFLSSWYQLWYPFWGANKLSLPEKQKQNKTKTWDRSGDQREKGPGTTVTLLFLYVRL